MILVKIQIYMIFILFKKKKLSIFQVSNVETFKKYVIEKNEA